MLALKGWLCRGITPSLEAALRLFDRIALDGWKQHYMNDYMPTRRDCKQCVRSSVRSKPYRRVNHPEAYALSVDLSGKMALGQD